MFKKTLLQTTKRFMSTAKPANQSIEGPVAQRIIAKLMHPTAVPGSLNSSSITHFELYNDSYKHAGHAGQKDLPNRQESHFRALIVSDAFHKMPPVKRHKLVYSVLQEELAHEVHALQLTLKTPAEYAKSTPP